MATREVTSQTTKKPFKKKHTRMGKKFTGGAKYYKGKGIFGRLKDSFEKKSEEKLGKPMKDRPGKDWGTPSIFPPGIGTPPKKTKQYTQVEKGSMPVGTKEFMEDMDSYAFKNKAVTKLRNK